ncbi:MAG: hypothetical protein Q7J54_04195 [Candidatus Woesearchaeota archaeon]|nr:hypothetical protein [Candidatus Woesearchaeota archaeon]
MEEKTKNRKFSFTSIKLLLVALILIVFLTNLFIIFGISSQIVVKKGVSSVYIKASSCESCSDLTGLVPALKNIGVVFGNEKTFDASSAEGKQLIDRYKILKLPAFIFSKEISQYEEVTSAWSQMGSVEKDGSYVLRLINPPYFDIAASKVTGFVDITYLTDNSCKACYNVTVHKIILSNPQSFGMAISAERYVDISSETGKELVRKYNITLVPTAIISKDAALYPSLTVVWPQVGSVESDGSYIFRDLSVLKVVYKNIANNTIINASSSAAAS